MERIIIFIAIADIDGNVKMTNKSKSASIDISDRAYFNDYVKGKSGESDILKI